MAKARSPQYPAIGLKEAIEKTEAVYKKDYQNPISREVAGAHMGFKSLHGNALAVLSALGKYGLLEGRGTETKVAPLAVTIIAHQTGDPERVRAIAEAAGKPKLFAELDARFPDGASDQAIRSYLLTQKYIPTAADTAIRAYRETKELVETESAGYHGGEAEREPAMPPASQEATSLLDRPSSSIPRSAPMAQEKFDLDEGPVTFSTPSVLSPESYKELADRIEIILRRLKRRSDAEAALRE
ncbi:MAG: hypothetical protein ABSA90_01700 [Xanthobacteraceae bacterium]